ncbi:MAG: TIR domain-containing protein [Bacilli bacterium]|nr:TIR domain-containing protein [Bacilli bacterium]
MATQQKIFIAFDGPNDDEAYQALKAMQQSDGTVFNITSARELHGRLDKESDESLKEKLYRIMDEASICMVLVGSTTKSYRRFIKWQIERALATSKPIIMVNENCIRTVDYDRCPTMMKKNLGLHIAFHAPIIEYALEHYPKSHQEHIKEEEHNPLRYTQEIYESLNLFTSDL